MAADHGIVHSTSMMKRFGRRTTSPVASASAKWILPLRNCSVCSVTVASSSDDHPRRLHPGPCRSCPARHDRRRCGSGSVHGDWVDENESLAPDLASLLAVRDQPDSGLEGNGVADWQP